MTHTALSRLAATALALLGSAAQAQMFTDEGFEALFKASKFAELDRAAQQRLAARAGDPQAVLAAGVAVQQGKSTSAQRKAAIARAEACIEQQPTAAECHFALGSTLGVHAMNEGMLTMATSASRVRDALVQALTLSPQWYAARSAVVTFYTVAPGVMGGSRDKALQAARAAGVPDQAKALQALIDLNSDKAEAALQALSTIRQPADSVLVSDLRDWGNGAAFSLINAGQAVKARAWFETAQRERPADAAAAYGLGRVHAESNAHAEALVWYERARKLERAEDIPIDYRVGISQQALGQAVAARAAFTRFIEAGKGQKKSLEDARKRLEQLGA